MICYGLKIDIATKLGGERGGMDTQRYPCLSRIVVGWREKIALDN